MSADNTTATPWLRAIDADEAMIRRMRRYLHAHPEPSGQEFKTTAYLAEHLAEIGAQFRIGPQGRGLVVDSAAVREGQPVIALRADLDALRMQDEKSVSYRSQEFNRMHACGHDAHTAMAFAAVKALLAYPDAMPGDFAWRCIFQPAEETAAGAKEMIACDALREVRAIVALHVDPTLMVGQVGWRAGALTACCEEFEIVVEGKGGHGARPHTTLDPIATATQLVQTIYAQLPRSLNAQEPLVVSFGVIQGGINPNVIPATVQLRGTIRSLDPEQSRFAKNRIREITDGIAQANAVTIRLRIDYSLPSVCNDPGLVALCRTASEKVVGPDSLVAIEHPSMGGEDFAWYLEHVPGCMLRLGVGTPLRPIRHLHATDFDIDEGALKIGAKVLVQSLLEIAHAGSRPFN